MTERRTKLGERVERFIAESSDDDSMKDIGWLLYRILEDSSTAQRFGLIERSKRGRPVDDDIRHSHIASEYLIEKHLRGNTRGAADAAKEAVCSQHPGLETRTLERYLKRFRVSAYILYRLAVNDGHRGLSGEPEMPDDVLEEIDRAVAELRKGFTTEKLINFLS